MSATIDHVPLAAWPQPSPVGSLPVEPAHSDLGDLPGPEVATPDLLPLDANPKRCWACNRADGHYALAGLCDRCHKRLPSRPTPYPADPATDPAAELARLPEQTRAAATAFLATVTSGAGGTLIVAGPLGPAASEVARTIARAAAAYGAEPRLVSVAELRAAAATKPEGLAGEYATWPLLVLDGFGDEQEDEADIAALATLTAIRQRGRPRPLLLTTTLAVLACPERLAWLGHGEPHQVLILDPATAMRRPPRTARAATPPAPPASVTAKQRTTRGCAS
jgi:hypothetical protein